MQISWKCDNAWLIPREQILGPPLANAWIAQVSVHFELTRMAPSRSGRSCALCFPVPTVDSAQLRYHTCATNGRCLAMVYSVVRGTNHREGYEGLAFVIWSLNFVVSDMRWSAFLATFIAF